MLVTLRITPLPPQVEHLPTELASFAPLPWQVLHSICFFTLIVLRAPSATSFKLSFTLMRRLLPRLPRERVCLPPPPPPKKLSNGSKPPPPPPPGTQSQVKNEIKQIISNIETQDNAISDTTKQIINKPAKVKVVPQQQ